MKKFIFFVAILLVAAGFAIAQDSGKSMQGMMKGEEGGTGMRMMKMMDQCSAMMESAHAGSDKANESQKQ